MEMSSADGTLVFRIVVMISHILLKPILKYAILMDDSSQMFVISSKFVNREYYIKFKVYMYI